MKILKKFHHKLYILSLLVCGLFVLLSFSKSNNTLEIHVHDTYFVVANMHIALNMALFYLLNSLVLFIPKKFKKAKLISLLYLLFTTLSITLFVISETFHTQSNEYIDLTNLISLKNVFDASSMKASSIVFYSISQLLFLIGIFTSIIKGSENRSLG